MFASFPLLFGFPTSTVTFQDDVAVIGGHIGPMLFGVNLLIFG